MNTAYELMVCFGECGYLYYNTIENKIVPALRDWADVMENNGYMNIYNLEPTYACLRDDNDNIVDETTGKVEW